MIEVNITDNMLIEARAKAKEMGQLKGSMMKGERNVIGFLGEIVTQSIIGGEFHNTYDYDIMTPSGKTVDVKSKRINYPPKDYYACNIFTYNEKQDCDYLVFCFVHSNLDKAWIAGYYNKKEFLKDCDFVPKGQVMGSGVVYKRDNYELKVSQLKPTSQLMEEFSEAAA